MSTTLDLPQDVRLMNLATLGLAVVFVLMGAVSLFVWAARHPGWGVAAIRVQGDVAHQNVVTLRTQLSQRIVGSFLTVDLKEVQRLFEAVPWVRHAVVQREFPDRLRVTLSEHRAAAWWGHSGEGRLISERGDVFEANPDDADADTLVELAGPDDEAAQVLAMYRDVVPLLARQQLGLQRLELSPRGGWRLELDNGAPVELGRGEPEAVLVRVRRFVDTLPQLAGRYGRELESADLRYPNGYAVKLRGVGTVEAGQAKGNRK